MPESKSRQPHKHPHHHPDPSTVHPKHKILGKVSIIIGLFVGLLGLGISFFIDSTSSTGLLTGAVVGGLIGLIFGYQIDKSLLKKR